MATKLGAIRELSADKPCGFFYDRRNEDQMAYFFVVGSMSSGGYLVYAILCSDPAMNPVLHENHFVAMATSVYRQSRERVRLENGDFFSDLRETQDFYSSWITSFLEATRSRYAPARHLAIKSFLLGPHCPQLHEILPSARFVISVRDPRDSVASMIEVGTRQQEKGGNNQFPRDVEKLASKVMSCYASCLASRDSGFKEKILYVKYERLVTDPSPIIEGMQSWTGLDLSRFDPFKPWQRTKFDFERSKASNGSFITEPYGQAVTSKFVGRYRNTLSVKETLTVERICAPIMQAFDYEPFESN